jgi:PAS domain S-box-containing protein
MTWFVSAVLFVFAFSGVVIAVAALNEYKTVQGRQLGVVLISTSTASFAYGMEILSLALVEKFTWVVVRYFALTVFGLAMSLFVFYFIHAPMRIKSWGFFFISLVPAISLFSQATYPLTHLVYDRIWLEPGAPISMIGKTVGPLYWIYNLYMVGLLIVLIYLVLHNMPRGSKLNRSQSLIIATALTLLVATHLLHLAGVSLLGVLNPNLFFYLPVALLILWGVKRYRLADIRPVARTVLFEQMQDGILVVDQSGNLIDINPAAEKYLNISQLEGIGKPLRTVAVELAGMSPDPGSKKKVASLLQLNGIAIQVTINQLLISQGEDGGYLIILRDMSDRMEAEELREKEIKHQAAWVERQKIARALHDSISQYLRSLVLLSNSARQRLGEGRHDQLDAVITHISSGSKQAAKEMDALIEELQIESPSIQHFDLIQAIHERADLISSQANLKIQCDAPDSLDLNPAQQREIFYILLEALNNILQHAHAGAVSILMKQGGGQFMAEICDNGSGFDPDQVHEGGMGLANMRERTRQLNGHLSVESRPCSGTRLCLVLPLAEELPSTEKANEAKHHPDC